MPTDDGVFPKIHHKSGKVRGEVGLHHMRFGHAVLPHSQTQSQPVPYTSGRHISSDVINRGVLGVSGFGILCRFAPPIGSPIEAGRSLAMPTRGCGPGRFGVESQTGARMRVSQLPCLPRWDGNVWVAPRGL